MGLTYNFADLLETLADAGPDRLMLDRAAEAAHDRPARRASDPTRQPPRRPRRRGRRPRRDPCDEPGRVVRGVLRLLQAPGGPDQHQLPLRRDRTALRLRQRRLRGDDHRTRVPPRPRGHPRRSARSSPTSSCSATTTRPRSPPPRPSGNFGPRSNDDIYIVFTGGTTGMPKGVMWRHEDAFFAVAGGGGMGGPPISSPEEIATKASGRVPDARPRHHAGDARRRPVGLLVRHLLRQRRRAVDRQALRRRRRCSTSSPPRGINSVQIIGDAMGRPARRGDAPRATATCRTSTPSATAARRSPRA